MTTGECFGWKEGRKYYIKEGARGREKEKKCHKESERGKTEERMGGQMEGGKGEWYRKGRNKETKKQ